MPTDLSGGENPRWQSDEPHYWDFYCIWDTFRCLHPFFSLVIPDKQVEMVRCLVDIYEHTGWLPDAWIGGGHGNVQGGDKRRCNHDYLSQILSVEL
jgi:putative alpha-1,2-mannosidase